MHKTSLYLPDRLKAALAARAAGDRPLRGRARSGRRSTPRWPTPATADLDAATGLDPAVPGRLVGVGVGPGDADLLTLRAVAALRRADRVVAPSTAVDAVGRAEAIVRQAVPGLRVERIPFAMAPGPSDARRARSSRRRRGGRVISAAGEEVAWITLGDPLIYSTFSAVAAAVRRRRPSTVGRARCRGSWPSRPWPPAPGRSSPTNANPVTIRTALDGEDLGADLADPTTTVVVYKGGRRLPELAERSAATAGRRSARWPASCSACPGERVGLARRAGRRLARRPTWPPSSSRPTDGPPS